MEARKCPKCSGDMDTGFIPDTMQRRYSLPSVWVEGLAEMSFWSGVKTKSKARYRIEVFRCRTCGFLEHYALDRMLDND